MAAKYDIVIIGGGPAGLTAGLYSCRARMKTLLLEQAAVGGQILSTEIIENYPGFPDGIASSELARLIEQQARSAGLEILTEMVEKVKVNLPPDGDGSKRVRTAEGEYSSWGLIVATGASPNKLGVPGEEKFIGRGVSYCAICDAPFFRDKDVVVVGGGDTAVEEALFLTKFARRVNIVHRRDRLRAARILEERTQANQKINFYWGSTLSDILGEGRVSAVRIKEVDGGKEEVVPCQGVFMYVGTRPNSAFLKGLVKTDKEGYVITNEHMRTSGEGIYACGDVRKKPLKQMVVACGEGATAAVACRQYVENIKKHILEQ